MSAIAVSHDNKFFATASDDGTVRIWDCHRLEGKAVTNRSRQQYTKQGGRIRALTLCENSHTVVSASDNGTIHVFRVEHASKRFTPLQQKSLDLEEDGCVVDVKHMENHESVLV